MAQPRSPDTTVLDGTRGTESVMREPRKNAHSSAVDTPTASSERERSTYTMCVSIRLHRRETCGCMPQQHRVTPFACSKANPGQRVWGKLAAWDVLRVPYGASRTSYSASAGFIAVERGVWVITVIRYPHTVCTCSRGAGAYMCLARPREKTGHVPTFNPSEIENFGILVLYLYLHSVSVSVF